MEPEVSLPCLKERRGTDPQSQQNVLFFRSFGVFYNVLRPFCPFSQNTHMYGIRGR
jgi:hypothetical protein